jgi:hypothetical protein
MWMTFFKFVPQILNDFIHLLDFFMKTLNLLVLFDVPHWHFIFELF